MPARSAVSLLAASAPIQRQCPCLPAYALNPPHRPAPSFKSIASAGPQHRGLLIARAGRPFHSTTARRDDAIDNARNHYETLKVAPTATTAEIKNLSKAHHPDLTPQPKRKAAAKRFMQISEAYSILSEPTKRATYDREHPHLHQSQPPKRQGSYASTGPAGGRPASGLSRRRGTFQGPPPSFFRSGGWGAAREKRQAAYEGARSSSGGMGPGQDPYGHGGEVPHFDRTRHEASWRHADKRRAARRATAEEREAESERGITGMFFLVGGVLLFSFIGPFIIGQIWYGGPRTKETGKDARKG